MAALTLGLSRRAAERAVDDPYLVEMISQGYEPWVQYVPLSLGLSIAVFVFVTLRRPRRIVAQNCFWSGIAILAAAAGWVFWLRPYFRHGRTAFDVYACESAVLILYLVPLGIITVMTSFCISTKEDRVRLRALRDFFERGNRELV